MRYMCKFILLNGPESGFTCKFLKTALAENYEFQYFQHFKHAPTNVTFKHVVTCTIIIVYWAILKAIKHENISSLKYI